MRSIGGRATGENSETLLGGVERSLYIGYHTADVWYDDGVLLGTC